MQNIRKCQGENLENMGMQFGNVGAISHTFVRLAVLSQADTYINLEKGNFSNNFTSTYFVQYCSKTPYAKAMRFRQIGNTFQIFILIKSQQILLFFGETKKNKGS